MTKKSLKRPRRKIIPLCYKKRSLSISNTSLSQLLSIGSYKKRINELVRNNRALAVALQESRCETAYQSDIIRDYTRDHNQIMFARLKLQGMAKTITQLVSDLHEVVNCLDVSRVSNNHLFQKNGIPRDRMKIRVPTMDCISEDVLSSENGDCAESSISEPKENEIPADKSSHTGEDTNEINPSALERVVNSSEDLDMPPILFVNDFEDRHVEKLSKERRSSRRCSVLNQASLTPELDLDFPCAMRKRSSSRRQTTFIPSAPSSNRSSRKSNLQRPLSTEDATPKRISELATHRKLSLALMNCEQYPEGNGHPESALANLKEGGSGKIGSPSSDLPFEEHAGINDILACPFINTKERGSKNASSSPPSLKYASENIGHDANFDNPSSVLHLSPPSLLPASAFSNNNTESNHTILTCEDMELTEVVRPVQQIISENSSNTVGCPLNHSDIQLNVPEENKELNMTVEKMYCDDKLTENCEKVSILGKDVHLKEIENDNYDSTINGEKICKNSEAFQHSVSPPKRSSRNRKSILYKIFLSSSESESDSTPIKSKVEKKKPNKTHRDTVIFKPKSCRKTSDKNDEHGNAAKCPVKELQENKAPQNPLSVYDLDVSNSKKPAKKSRPKSKTKKHSHNKEISKPLLPNCNVTKLKGIKYKFTKNENSINKVKDSQLLQNCSYLPEANPAITTDETIKADQPNCSNNAEAGSEVENKQKTSSTEDDLSSGKTDFKHHEPTFKSPKRVSFAPTDLVCNFTRMSVSKTIADNKKELYASKSAFQQEGLSLKRMEPEDNQQPSEMKDSAQFETNKLSNGIPESPQNSEQFIFNEETELYSFMFPHVTHQTSTKADKLSSSEKTVSSDTVPLKINDCHDQNSKLHKLTVKKNHGKLSLKGKNCQNKAQVHTSDKINKDVLSEVLDLQSSVIPSKCKSSHGNLKENREHINPETLDIPQTEKKGKSKTSKRFHLPSIENIMPIPIDDIAQNVIKSKEDNLSQEHLLPLPSSDTTSKKSSTRRRNVESSPVLRDLLNLEVNDGDRASTKRRSKAVCYKEPPLNKKLRR